VTLLGSISKTSLKGKPYTIVTVRTEQGEIVKLFSDVSLVAYIDTKVTLSLEMKPDQSGFGKPFVKSVA